MAAGGSKGNTGYRLKYDFCSRTHLKTQQSNGAGKSSREVRRNSRVPFKT